MLRIWKNFDFVRETAFQDKKKGEHSTGIGGGSGDCCGGVVGCGGVRRREVRNT